MKHSAAGRRGFTLVEVLVALAIAGLVVLTVHRLVSATVDQANRATRARAQLDRRENAVRWLGEAVGSLDVGRDEPGPFVGTVAKAEFATWLRQPDGWYEPDRVTLGRVDDRLVASLRSGKSVVLADSVADAEIDYLVEGGASAPWLRVWSSSVNTPLALRVRVRRGLMAGAERVDTAVFLVWRRG